MKKHHLKLGLPIFLGACLFALPVQAGGMDDEEVQSQQQEGAAQLALPDPRADMMLSPLQNMYHGERFFCRPVFPKDHVALRGVFCDPQVMRLFGPGVPYTTGQVERHTAMRAENNLKPPYVWTGNPLFQDPSQRTEAFTYEVGLEQKAIEGQLTAEGKALALAAYQEQRRQETAPAFHWSVFVRNASLKEPFEAMDPEACVVVGRASCDEPHEERGKVVPYPECYMGLCRQAQGLGIASELGAGMLDRVGGTVYATAHPDNHASQNVILRQGFHRAPELDIADPKYTRLAFLRPDPEQLTEAELTSITEAQNFAKQTQWLPIGARKALQKTGFEESL